MTREEIRAKAIEIVNETRGSDALPEDYGAVEFRLVALARATLQEAARAVCRRCTTEFPERDDQGIYYWHTPGPYGSILCDAAEIHGLIAALDKEGDK